MLAHDSRRYAGRLPFIITNAEAVNAELTRLIANLRHSAELSTSAELRRELDETIAEELRSAVSEAGPVAANLLPLVADVNFIGQHAIQRIDAGHDARKAALAAADEIAALRTQLSLAAYLVQEQRQRLRPAAWRQCCKCRSRMRSPRITVEHQTGLSGRRIVGRASILPPEDPSPRLSPNPPTSPS